MLGCTLWSRLEPAVLPELAASMQDFRRIKALDAAGVDYETVDLTTDPDALDYVQSLGYLQAPVIVTDHEHWAGFHPDRCKALAA